MNEPSAGARELWAMREPELLERVTRAEERVMWSGILAKAATPDAAQVAQRVLDERATVGPLDGLAAGARLVELVTGNRWSLMRQAREDGATWEQVGAAVSLTEQQARSWYAGQVDAHEQHAPEYFDTTRDRAVLDDAARPAQAEADDGTRDETQATSDLAASADAVDEDVHVLTVAENADEACDEAGAEW